MQPEYTEEHGTLPGYLRTVVAQPRLSHAGQLTWRLGLPPDRGAPSLTWPNASLTGPESCGRGISGRSLRTRPTLDHTMPDLGLCGGRCWVRTNVG
jgi:hypothetical protein